MHETTLMDIPMDVVQRSAFQFLRANELLRIRRACHWSKFLVDDYHRPLGPPFGSKKIRLILPSTTNEVIQPGWQSLASFLEEDNTNSLGKLCLRFKLDWNMDLNEKVFENPLIKDFIDRYGSQIDHLSVRKMFVPPGQHELEFYSKLPKLKSLSVLQACLNTDNLNEYAFPECFGKISKLKVAFIREKAPEGGVAPASFGGIGHDVFQWRLLAFCKSLRHYEAAYFTQLTLLGLIMLDTRLSRLQYYSSKNGNGIHPNDSWSEDELPFPIESNLKWANVPLYYLSSLSLTSRNFVAPRIVSVGGFRGSETFDDGFVLPNVESMRLNGGMLGENDSHARLIGQLSHEMLPMLKRVQIHNWENSTNAGASRMLSMLWSRLPNLEEVKFKKCSIEDIAFIGEGGEPPFLQLTGLKTLDLGNVCGREGEGGLSDAAFLQVFQHLRLREFRMSSLLPLTSITSAGIEALTTGPFRDTIEVFPFHGWSLDGMDMEEFQLLAQKFPNNQPV